MTPRVSAMDKPQCSGWDWGEWGYASQKRFSWRVKMQTHASGNGTCFLGRKLCELTLMWEVLKLNSLSFSPFFVWVRLCIADYLEFTIHSTGWSATLDLPAPLSRVAGVFSRTQGSCTLGQVLIIVPHVLECVDITQWLSTHLAW